MTATGLCQTGCQVSGELLRFQLRKLSQGKAISFNTLFVVVSTVQICARNQESVPAVRCIDNRIGENPAFINGDRTKNDGL